MTSIGAILPVGTIIHSMLTTAQFATEYGDNWVLADGRSVTGTRYAYVTGNTTIPDMRAVFLRGKDNSRGLNPDGDLALGTYSADKLGSHTHDIPGGAGTGALSYDRTASGAIIAEGVTLSTGGNETASKSVTVNIYIRIN